MRWALARWAERWARICLALLIATLPFWRHRVLLHREPEPVFFEFHDVILYTNDLFWLGAIGCWLGGRLIAPQRRPWRFGPAPLFGGILALIALSTVSLAKSIDRPHTLYSLMRLLLLLELYLLVVNMDLSRRWIAIPLAAGVFVQAALAFPQFVAGRWIGLKRLGEVPFDRDWPGTSVVITPRGRWPRAYGWTQHPNILGSAMAFSWLGLAGTYLGSSGLAAWGWLGAVSVALGTGLISYSRGAWLGLLAGAVPLLLATAVRYRSRRVRTLLALLIASQALIVATFAASQWETLAGRIGISSPGTEIRSIEERDTLVAGAMVLIRRAPLTGVGLGNFATALYHYAQDAVAAYPIYQPVHNVPLLATAELGIGGGAAWTWLTLSPWIVLWQRRHRISLDPWLAAWSGVLAALGVMSLFDYYTWSSHQGQLMQWLSWGVWASALSNQGGTDGP